MKWQKSSRAGHRVTIAEVARAAGVSAMTVSRVINGAEKVDSRTRERIQERIAALGYSPNPAARALASAGLARITLIYSNPSEAYLSRFLVGVLAHTRCSAVELVLERCEGEGEAAALVAGLEGKRKEGLLLPPPLSDSATLLSAVRASGIPAVAVGGHTMVEEISTVCIDDQLAAFEMTRHIVSLGHRAIGFILGQASQSATARRLAGYRRALAEGGLPLDERLIVEGAFSYRSGLAAAEALLAAPRPPTAIFASNDDMAAAAIAVASRHGLKVPRDLTVCGFDDTEVATTIWPELTTIHQPVEDMAKTAAALLENIIRSHAGEGRRRVMHRQLDHQLVRRSSEGPPRRAARRSSGWAESPWSDR